MPVTRWRCLFTLAVAAIGLACASSAGGRERPLAASAASSPAGTNGTQTIDHITPKRDSTGPTPARFEWTRVQGAETYAVGLWNDVDVLVMRASEVRAPFLEWPTGQRLEPGTYFWSVTAFRDGRPIAESGRSAFVVLPQ